MTTFNTPLRVMQVDQRRWRTIAPLVYESHVARSAIIVPPRFITDFASVPRLPGVWLVAGGLGELPATVHDWLYQRHEIERPAMDSVPVTKELADAVFYEALVDRAGIAPWRAWTMWKAVDLFAGTPWRTGPDRFAALNPIWFAERARLGDMMAP